MRLLIIAAAFLGLAGAPALAAQTAESKACSDQATAKGLKGAEREKFRAACLKSAAPMAAAPAKPAAAPMAAAPVKPAAAPMAAPAKAGFAPKSDAAKACSDQATAKGLHGKDRETFRNGCLKGAPAPAAMAAAPAKPAPMAAPAKPAAMADATPPEPGKAMKAAPASGKPRTANQLASDARIKKCGALWQADKAAGKTAGQTWPKYWSACSARLKAAGQ